MKKPNDRDVIERLQRELDDWTRRYNDANRQLTDLREQRARESNDGLLLHAENQRLRRTVDFMARAIASMAGVGPS